MAEKKVKVRVLDATVYADGKAYKSGETVTIDEKSAKHLESIRYVARVGAAASESKTDEGKKGDE